VEYPEIEDPKVAAFFEDVIKPVARQEGDTVPVSKMAPDGAFLTATAQYEKRSIATQVPQWNPAFCIQCNLCSFVCPHASIRPKIHKLGDIKLPADKYVTVAYKDKNAAADDVFHVQVFPEDCTGCEACAVTCD
jgi:pyruvate-ferredoxin/flavodoxin oxidoreductase